MEEDKTSKGFESLNTLRRRWKDGTFSEILDDWRWILSYSARYKGAIVFYTLLGLFSTTLGLVSAVAGKYLIDIITGYQLEKLGQMIAIMLGSTAFNLVFGSVINRISTKLIIDINNDIQADIFDRIMDADWLELSRYANGDILNRFNGDIETVSGNAISYIPTIVNSIYSFLATLVVILHYDVVMALIAFVSAPVLLLMSRYVLKVQREYGKKTREMSSRLMTFEVETFYNMDTIKSFGIAPSYGQKMRDWQGKFKKVSLDHNLFAIKTNIWMSLLGTGVNLLSFGYCLFRLWTHDISYGTMTLFLQQRSNLSGAFSGMVSLIPAFLNSSVSAHRIRELVELKKEVHIPVADGDGEAFTGSFSVEMQDLEFSYVEGTKVVHAPAFHAQPGEIVALVGPSGGGKTTMVRLILGLVHPEEGTAVLRKADGEEIPLNADTRYLFSYVPQGNTILSGTIAENLQMGNEGASREAMVEALKTACAWDFVEKLPGQLDANLGERGRGLSEGQAQRIAIARAVLRDAPVMILDEATAALDARTERQVLRNIVQDRPDKTVIVTTHRPGVLKLCKRIYRVQDTQLTEIDQETASFMAMDY